MTFRPLLVLERSRVIMGTINTLRVFKEVEIEVFVKKHLTFEVEIMFLSSNID